VSDFIRWRDAGVHGDVEQAKASPEALKNRPTVRFTTNALLKNATLRRAPLGHAAITCRVIIGANKPGDAPARRQ
jgi:hypothetical protein